MEKVMRLGCVSLGSAPGLASGHVPRPWLFCPLPRPLRAGALLIPCRPLRMPDDVGSPHAGEASTASDGLFRLDCLILTTYL